MHPDNFMDSVKHVLLNYANFTGRARRPEFWWFVLFSVIVSIVTMILDGMIFGGSLGGLSPLNTISGLALIIPSLAVGARRLHDIGKSGWWQLIGIIPIIGWIVIIYFFAKKGDEGENAFGAA